MLSLLLVALVGCARAGPARDAPKCGYDSCTQAKEGYLNVHIVPHTHDDVGWLKTVDQYYYGSRNNIQKAGVQYILDSVVKELWEDPARRFIYVETAFFWKWWELQPKEVKDKVHTLVSHGRLKFVGGAWSMNDEANTYYQTTIDQFTWGLSKLNETFGECGRPTVGWQIDPFGHSREFASLLKGMGYDGLFLGRIDYQDKQARMRNREMEVIWRGDDDLGEASDIFTSILYNTYSPPSGFCFDVLCQDEPIIDDPNSPDYNVDRRVTNFIDYARDMSGVYTTDNVLITMGGDFTYMQAGMWYENIDKIILYGNLQAAQEDLKINLFYSTPDCYLKAVKDANPTLPTKQDDFFPYASDPHAYWTGYFSSRPTVKYLEAHTNIYLQMVKQLQVLAQLPDNFMPHVDQLRNVMGVMQHHDAVTGTEKQHVANDYVRMVTKAIHQAHDIPTAAFNKMMHVSSSGFNSLSFEACKLNESSCEVSEKRGAKFIVTLYNPLAWEVATPVHVPVDGGEYTCKDSKGNSYSVQISEIPEQVFTIPTRESTATKQATFIASLPPLGFKSFYLAPAARRKRSVKYGLNIEDYFNNIRQGYSTIREADISDNSNINENHVKYIPEHPQDIKYTYDIYPDERTQRLLKTKDFEDRNVKEFEKLFDMGYVEPKRRHFENPYYNMGDDEMRMLADDPMVVTRYPDEEMADQSQRRNTNPSIEQSASMLYYPGMVGNNYEPKNRSSGAYIFRPSAQNPIPVHIDQTDHITGPLFHETRIKATEKSTISIRYYENGILKFDEVEWIVGPIPVDDNVGKEFIVRYETNLKTDGVMYTDSNGRQMLKRIKDKRPQWNLTLAEPVAGNYYPVTAAIQMEDSEGKAILIMPDRAVGVGSLNDGYAEIMVHRRLLHDDAFGVGEALNETVDNIGLIARGTIRHHTNFDGQNPFKEILEARLRPLVFITDASSIEEDKWKDLVTEYSWLKAPLPDSVHLLTVEPWGKKLLLRLENFGNETREVDLTNILKGIDVKSAKETHLAANSWHDDSEQWTWNNMEEFSDDFNKEYGTQGERVRARVSVKETDDGFKVKITKKQIRTFIIGYERS